MFNLDYDYRDFCDQQEYECPKCIEHEEIITEAQDFLAEVIEQVYAKKAFDSELLEHALDSLACLLGAGFLMNSANKMMIQKKVI